ncbi:methyltransferase [Maritimibacter sp. 55A14]|uniref:class I SAM-dependent methyltransferase n=1 Tax=Maritimibacter sp. 55A14 TaxID=2174844 RepID=UPI000D6178F2|nr:SAM-dependent methyltransferase [Maritimibacter sp. 55A14]PWE29443.1 methyltransferase [Maritimibacter sp. 55A14]
MTPLMPLLRSEIAQTGPMTLADYMVRCLLHPDHGYYMRGDPLGRAGDFTTAPEISQMFGEMLGLALAQAWLDQGSPASFTLAELGPGRGTLMADMLRAARPVPGFLDAARIVLVETSPALRARQKEALRDREVTWVSDTAALPEDAPLYLVANEFFDALPVRQFIRDGDIWRERCVGLAGEGLGFALSGPVALPPLEARRADTAHGEMVTLCPAAGPVMAEIARRIAAQGGAALIVDYGDAPPRGDTFQAVAAHRPTDPLAAPGSADLTAHVDFGALAGAAQDAEVAPMTPQGVLLERLGITARARALAETLEGDALEGDALDAHIAAHRRLTHPQEMGSLFKAIGLYPKGGPVPPGFDR